MDARKTAWKTLHPDDSPGPRRYEILQEIASGGSATVYLACQRGHAGFERLVALKLAMPAESGLDPSRVLAREARIASQLHHPHIVAVTDIETVEGRVMLVMPYVEGASLAQLIARGPLPSAVALRIAVDVASALEHVHSLRSVEGTSGPLVHRDVSPQNILVGTDGITRLADFGIASSTTSRLARDTLPGRRRGKPGYMSPEYVRHGVATPGTDAYALSVVLWEALTGRRLYPCVETLDELEELRREPAPPPSAFVECSPALDAAVLSGLRCGDAERSVTILRRAWLAAHEEELAAPRELAAVVEARAAETLWVRRGIVEARMRESSPEPTHGMTVRETRTRPDVPLAKRRETPARRTSKLQRQA